MPPKKAAKGTKAKASKAGTGAKKKTVKKATAKKSVAAEPSKEEEAPAAAAAPSAPAKPEPASRFATLVAEGSDGGIAKIVLTDLNDAIDVILAAGKTPLLLDNDRKTVETFFSYSSGVMVRACPVCPAVDRWRNAGNLSRSTRRVSAWLLYQNHACCR